MKEEKEGKMDEGEPLCGVVGIRQTSPSWFVSSYGPPRVTFPELDALATGHNEFDGANTKSVNRGEDGSRDCGAHVADLLRPRAEHPSRN